MWVCILLSDFANLRVIRLWSIARAERQTKLSFRRRSAGHNLQTSLHLLRLKGFMETVRATPHSPLPRLLPCTHYNAMKTILRHGSGLQPHSRPPGISQCCNDVRPATFCFLISCTQHAHQSFFITGVWTNAWVSERECGYVSVQTA